MRDVTDEQNGRLPALDENLEAVRNWEQTLLEKRSGVERMGDWITSKASGAPVLVAHLLWFGGWVGVNLGLIGAIAPFDPFPFPTLTTLVSFETIVLALFVLASQNRLARQSDRRGNLNLQIDLLTEREITAVLRLLRDIARHLGVTSTVPPEELRDLLKETDVKSVTTRLEELPASGAAAADAATSPAAAGSRPDRR